MSFTNKQRNRAGCQHRRQCDRCGKLAKDAETGTYPRPKQPDGVIKNRIISDLNAEWCDECWKIVQAESRRSA